jgi:hypothetical protein
MKLKQYVIFLLFLGLFLSLTACGQYFEGALFRAKGGYITDMDGMRILVNDTYFTADQDIIVESADGKKLKFSDLEIGTFVEPWYSGAIRESFPAQGDVKKIVVSTDKDHIRAKTAVKAIVDYAEDKFGKPVVFQDEATSNETFFQVMIAGTSLENPNPKSIRYTYATKEVGDFQ